MENFTEFQRNALRTRFRSCLLGGAVGDALGAPVEFLSRRAILQQFGPDGITDYAPAWGGIGRITDDTQMTLFTAEGLLRGWIRDCLRGITTYSGLTAAAYRRWLATQGEAGMPDAGEKTGWIFRHAELHVRRAPGNTCLSALQAMQSTADRAINDSKGCGGVMRVAPVGLFAARLGTCLPADETFRLGSATAAVTHGHPTGQLSAGVLAVVIRELVTGADLPQAIECARNCLVAVPDHGETLAALDRAVTRATSEPVDTNTVASLGKGWVAEEALAIALYCALVADDFASGLILAVNHDGDSDSTGAIAGNLLGAWLGETAIPGRWLEPLELRAVITEVAYDLADFPDWPISEYGEATTESKRIVAKYPGC